MEMRERWEGGANRRFATTEAKRRYERQRTLYIATRSGAEGHAQNLLNHLLNCLFLIKIFAGITNFARL